MTLNLRSRTPSPSHGPSWDQHVLTTAETALVQFQQARHAKEWGLASSAFNSILLVLRKTKANNYASMKLLPQEDIDRELLEEKVAARVASLTGQDLKHSQVPAAGPATRSVTNAYASAAAAQPKPRPTVPAVVPITAGGLEAFEEIFGDEVRPAASSSSVTAPPVSSAAAPPVSSAAARPVSSAAAPADPMAAMMAMLQKMSMKIEAQDAAIAQMKKA